eukprot:14941960-Alexandrium_andersonii.AAC.1
MLEFAFAGSVVVDNTTHTRWSKLKPKLAAFMGRSMDSSAHTVQAADQMVQMLAAAGPASGPPGLPPGLKDAIKTHGLGILKFVRANPLAMPCQMHAALGEIQKSLWEACAGPADKRTLS